MPAAIILNPTHAKVGTSVLITGSGFNTGDTMSFTYGGSPITPTEAPIVVAGDGTLPTCHIVIPASVEGINAVVASDASLNTATANFTVDSFISISPTSQDVGGSITVTGTGFATASLVTLLVGGIDKTPVTHITDATGGFTFAGIVVPSLPHGTQVVSATDAATNNAVTNLTVTSSLSLSPDSGRIGSTSTVTAHGLAANSAITIDFAGTDVTPGGSPVSDANGDYTGTITVPTKASGARTVTLTDASANAPTATYTVSAPTLTRSPTHGPKGTVVQLNGANYIPSHSITITNIDGTTSVVTADSSGNLPTNTPITTGPNVQGSHNITASDGTNTATAAFTTDTSLSVSPTSGKVDDTITITGEGYANASGVSSTFAGSSVTTSPGTPSPSSAGHFTSTFVIPDAVQGTNAVACTDAAMNTATANVTVQPSASIDPVEGPAGELLTIDGDGFAGTSAITLTLDGTAIPAVSPITSGADGDISGTLQLPQSLAKGDHTIVITDASSNSVSLTYTVNKDLLIQVTVHNPSKQYAGLPTGKIAEEGIPVANSSYVTVGIIDMSNFIRATLEMYNPDETTTVTFQILGMIDDGSGIMPDATSEKWLAISAYTDVDVTAEAGKLVEITTRYSWLRIDVKASSDSSIDIYGSLQAF